MTASMLQVVMVPDTCSYRMMGVIYVSFSSTMNSVPGLYRYGETRNG